MKANEVFDTDRGSLRARLAAFPKFSILTPGFVLWLVVLPAWGKTGACAQQREGFVGYAWGTGFTRMAGEFDLTPTLENGHTLQYSTTLQQIGAIEQLDCEFEFTDGRFSGVILLAERPDDAQKLLTLLIDYYGKRLVENARACQWLTAETHAAYDECVEGDAYVYIYSLSFQPNNDSYGPQER